MRATRITRRTRSPAGAARMIARLKPGSSATVHSAVYSPARPAIRRYGSPSWRRKLSTAASGARPMRPSRSPDGIQPRFVEFKPGGEQIRDALMQARHEQASNAGFNHAQDF